jgi:asparagine synthetase B (glutamine-hydrolysing)
VGGAPTGELRQELVARLEAAVDRVLNGHQRVALALSGGLDSSVLASLLSARDVECRSYNLAVDHGGTNEASAARMMARHVSMPHVELPFRFADFIREWSHSSKTAPHPVGFSEELLVSYIARKAADSEELLITGHGAAELLGGHGAMLRSGDDQMILEQLQENPQLSKEPTLQRFLARARRVYGRPLPSDAFAFLSRRYARSSENLLQDLLGPGFLARAGEPGRVAAPLQSSLNQTVGRDGKERILHFFRTVHLPAQAQVMERACSMGGLPLGTPYLDSELIRFSTQLPIDVLLRWKGELERRAAAGECADDVAGSLDQDRHLLRATFGSQLPRRGAQRRHVPFSAPLSQWFGEEAGQELLREILLDGHLGNDGVFSRPALERKLAEIESAEMRPDRIPLLFRAASLELWHRELVARATQPVVRRATVPAC